VGFLCLKAGLAESWPFELASVARAPLIPHHPVPSATVALSCCAADATTLHYNQWLAATVATSLRYPASKAPSAEVMPFRLSARPTDSIRNNAILVLGIFDCIICHPRLALLDRAMHETECVICRDSSPSPIQSGCACRGPLGLAHTDCRAQAAGVQASYKGSASASFLLPC